MFLLIERKKYVSHLDDLVVLELLGQVVPGGGKFLLEKIKF